MLRAEAPEGSVWDTGDGFVLDCRYSLPEVDDPEPDGEVIGVVIAARHAESVNQQSKDLDAIGINAPLWVEIEADNAQEFSLAYQSIRFLPHVDAIVINHREAEAYGDTVRDCIHRIKLLRRFGKPLHVSEYPADAPDVPGVDIALPPYGDDLPW